jgi:hypothetical protein
MSAFSRLLYRNQEANWKQSAATIPIAAPVPYPPITRASSTMRSQNTISQNHPRPHLMNKPIIAGAPHCTGMGWNRYATLNHTIPGVAGVYRRHNFVEEKKAALEGLATLVLDIVGPTSD